MKKGVYPYSSLEALSAPDEFATVLASLSQIEEVHRNVATKLKGVCDGVLNATVGTLAGALYAAFAVKPKT
jgi:hypothetical protein